MARGLILCSPVVWLLYASYLLMTLLLLMTSSSYYYQMMTIDGRCYLILAQGKIESLIYWNVSSSLEIDCVYLLRPMALYHPLLQLQVVVTTVSHHHPYSYMISPPLAAPIVIVDCYCLSICGDHENCDRFFVILLCYY